MRRMWLSAILTALVWPGLTAAPPDPRWLTDLDAAKKIAASEKRNLYVLFIDQERCPFCARFTADVLNRSGFDKFLKNNDLVMVFLEFSKRTRPANAGQRKNLALAGDFGVVNCPTAFILDSQGKIIGSVVGTNWVDNYVKKLEKILKDNDKQSVAKPVPPPGRRP